MNIYEILQEREPDVDWIFDLDNAVKQYEAYAAEVQLYAADLRAYIERRCRSDYALHDFDWE